MSEFRQLEKEERVGRNVISASGLIELFKSPKHFHSRYILKEGETSAAMEEGNVFHTAILEPEKYNERYQVMDDKAGYLQTKDDLVAYLAEQKIEHKKSASKMELIEKALAHDPAVKIWDTYLKNLDSSRQVISSELHKTSQRALESAKAHKWLKVATEGAIFEQPGYWEHSSGTLITFRLDILNLSMGKHKKVVVGDVKKSRSADPHYFSKVIWDSGLYIQAAVYVAAVKAITGVEPLYFWPVFEPKPPYCLEVYAADFGMLEAGNAVMEKMIQKFLDCKAQDSWPGYTPTGDITNISLPFWAFSKLDEFAETELPEED